MNNLKNFIKDNIITESSIKTDKDFVINELRKIIINYLIDNNFTKNGINVIKKLSDVPRDKKEHFNEICRFFFRSDDDDSNLVDLNNIINLVNKSHINNLTEFKLEDNGKSEIAGRLNGSSSTYLAYKFKCIYNKETFYLYICNTNKGEALLKSKMLAPDKLLKQHTFFDKENYINILKKSISNRFGNNPIYNNVILVLNALIDDISNINLQNRTGSFMCKTLTDFFEYNGEGKLDIIVSKNTQDLLLNLSKADIGCIEKDFGEILGGLLFLSLFNKEKDLNLVYPVKSNEPLIDYYISGHKISAKQLGGGGKPSGTAVFLSSYNNYNKQLDLMQDISDINLKYSKFNYNKKEIEFIKNVASTYDKKYSVIEQFIILISNYILKDSNIFDNDQLKIFESINSVNDDDKVDMIVGKDPTEFFNRLLNDINYNNIKRTSFDYKHITLNNWYKTKNKVGILLYPLWKVTIDKLNDIYGGQNDDIDVISSIINKQIDMKQIYFGIRDKKMKIQIVSSKNAKWSLSTGGMSINNINNSKMAIFITH